LFPGPAWRGTVGREPTVGGKAQADGSSTTPGDHTTDAEHAQRAIGRPEPYNKGKLVGPKPPFKLKEIWALRIRLQIAKTIRDQALFSLAIDRKLRGCDLVNLPVGDVAHGGRVVARTTVARRKTDQPVRFELTERTRGAVEAWIAAADLRAEQFLFPSHPSPSPQFSTRQYSKIVKGWATLSGVDAKTTATTLCDAPRLR